MSPSARRLALALPVLLLPAPALAADPALIEAVCGIVRDNYVFPDVGAKAADLIARRAAEGRYDDFGRQELAAALTRDLRAFTKDLHFGAEALPEGWTPPPEDRERPAPAPRELAPFGVHKVERLGGNVGYLDLRGFFPADLAGDAILSAVRLLQGSSAVVLDLRHNGGGDPACVQLLCSYFFDPAEPVHLNSLYFRPTDETTEFWTNAEFPELAMPDVPLFVLTSPGTFSGGEECAYNFQTRGRAVIIGETTGGGAHPVDGFVAADAILVRVPTGRAINPITNTNWEGVGVRPDVQVPAEKALDEALRRAYTLLTERGDPRARWGLYQLAARDGSVEVDPETLASVAGRYTDRELELRDGVLQYRRTGAPAWRPLVPVAPDVFMVRGVENFRLEVRRDASGAVTGLTGVYAEGREDHSPRES